MLAQHWCDQLEDHDLGSFDACSRLFDEGFDDRWTCFKVYEQEGVKMNRFGCVSRRVAEDGAICCNRLTDSSTTRWSLASRHSSYRSTYPFCLLIVLNQDFSNFRASLCFFLDFLTLLFISKSPSWVLALFGQFYPFIIFYFSKLSSGKDVI